jgi:hypothetical protein
MKHLLFLLLVTIIFYSCEQKNKHDEVIRFSKTLYTYTSLNIKSRQQAFINQTQKELEKIKDNNEVKVDTKYLRELLDSAKEANRLSYSEISKLQEVDEQINIREKALNEIQVFTSAYKN